jgi:hypothetical protein
VFQRYLRQPPVIGEIVAGLMLGPSLLGAMAPGAYAALLPAAAAPLLGVIAKIGVVLFMFLVGLELDPRRLRGHGHTTLAISHASIVTPFLLGATLALALYPLYSNSSVSFTVFSLFLGVSLSVTAFPVLARILTDRRVQHTPLGVTALTCAAVDDVSAWTLLAFVVSVASAEMGDAAWTVAVRGGLPGGDVRGGPAAAGPLRGARGREDGAAVAVGAGGGVRRAAAVGAGDRGERDPRAVRGVPAGRRSCRTRAAGRADPGAARGRGGGAVPAGVLRVHRDAHADRAGQRGPTGWCAGRSSWWRRWASSAGRSWRRG